MSRVYTCTNCNLPKTAGARGPLPEKCPDCKPRVNTNRQGPPLPRTVKSNAVSVRPERIAQDIRVTEAIRLRLEYRTWNEIADQLGWATKTGPFMAVRAELERRRQAMDDSLDELRTREFDRLEALAKEAFKVLHTEHLVTSGGNVVFHQDAPLLDDGPKLAAINTLVKVSDSLRKLLGLDAASKVDAAVTVQFTVKGVAEEEMP